MQETPLRHESEAARLVDPWKARTWLVVNPHTRNLVGAPTAYKLVPGDNTLPLAAPDASVMQRAAFMSRHLWVTAYDPSELYAAGDYPNQHPGGAGLPAYIAQDRPLKTPAWCSGTRSTIITSSGRRTGRWRRWPRSASSCSPAASSTATPPSTFLPVGTTAAQSEAASPLTRVL